MKLSTLNDISNFKTPCYVYKASVIKKQIANLKRCFKDIQIKYSLKASSFDEVIKQTVENKLGCDVASLKELKKALKIGVIRENISFVGPGKNDEELKYSIDMEIGNIIVESVSELLKIITISIESKKNVNVLIRINPSFELLETTLSMGGNSQFGIDETQVEVALGLISSNKQIKLNGFHFYVRSQEFELKHLIAHYKYSMLFSNTMIERFNLNLNEVNLGGGIPIAYFKNQSALNFDILSTELEVIKQLNINNLKMTVESGRYIAGPAGWFVVKVLYLKTVKGIDYAIVDGGFTNNSLITGLGQVLKRNFPVIAMKTSKEEKVYTIAGPSCTPLDILGTDIELPTLVEGDLLCFPNCGAYGFEYSPINFIGLEPAKQFLIE